MANKVRGYVWIIMAVMALLFAASMVFAHDYNHPELKDWFMSLHSRKGFPCCDGSDASHVSAEDWTTQDKPDSHYKVNIEGVWTDVPDSALVDDPNKDPDQQALVWYYPMWTGTVRSYAVRCFMPGTLS